MKKKEKELTKKARKQIRESLEEMLIEEIKKAIVAQGRNPKKVTREIKKSASLIAKKLADKESISQPVLEKDASEATDNTERINSFDVPAVPAAELPAVAKPSAVEPPAAKPRRVRKVASQPAAEAEAVPVKPVRKRTPRVAKPKDEPIQADADSSSQKEESTSSVEPDENKID